MTKKSQIRIKLKSEIVFKSEISFHLRSEQAFTTTPPDLFHGPVREITGSNHHRKMRHTSLAQHMRISCFNDVNEWHHPLCLFRIEDLFLDVSGNNAPNIIDIDALLPVPVWVGKILPPPMFSEITGMPPVDPRFVVMFGPRHTPTTGVFVVTAHSPVTHLATTAHFATFPALCLCPLHWLSFHHDDTCG